MNSVGGRKPKTTHSDDFFTSLSFSALMGELSDKENMITNFGDVEMEINDKIKIKSEFDRIWNAKENQNFINKIFL